MKTDELTKMVMAGGTFCVGTYLSGRMEPVSMRDKANPGGPRRLGHSIKEVIVTDAEPIVISRWLKDDEKPELWKPSAEKGKKVVVRINRMETTREGIIVMSGMIEALV